MWSPANKQAPPNQSVLRLDQDAFECRLVQIFEGGEHWQTPDELRDQTIFQQVLRLDLTEDLAGLAVLWGLHGSAKTNGGCPASGRDDLLQTAEGAATHEEDVRSGPGGNATGFNFFGQETQAKLLSLLNELVPKAVRVGVLLNPTNAIGSPITLREVSEAADVIGLQIQVVNASTIGEINAAFAALAGARADALVVASDAFLISRRVQLATLAARDRIPTASFFREVTVAGGLMSYGTDNTDSARQLGVYTGNILKGAKPAELPVQQAVKFSLVINLGTATLLGIEVPATLLAYADEVIE
jgi:ABC-type uncharacterized transport system substrate-binding protein